MSCRGWKSCRWRSGRPRPPNPNDADAPATRPGACGRDVPPQGRGPDPRRSRARGRRGGHDRHERGSGAAARDGRPAQVVDFRVRPAERSIEIEITLAEGRQRIVRRLAEALGLKVEWLHRVSYGPVRLGRLAEGKYRRLAANEVEAIERLHGPA